jgi:preprotein translocase subunit SecD
MAVGSLWVAFLPSPDSRISGLVAVLAAAIVVAMVLQIVVYRAEGLVSRLSLALTGNVLLTLVFAVAFQVWSQVE